MEKYQDSAHMLMLESKGPAVIYDTEKHDLYFCLNPADGP